MCIFFVVGYSAFLLQQRYPVSSTLKRQLGLWAIPALVLGAFLFAIHPLLCVPLVVIVFYSVAWRVGVLSRWLENRPFLFLGRISFSLYLVHPFVLDPLRTLCKHLAVSYPLAAAVIFPVAGVPLAIAISTLSWLWIEQRFTQWLLHRRDNDVITAS